MTTRSTHQTLGNDKPEELLIPTEINNVKIWLLLVLVVLFMAGCARTHQNSTTLAGEYGYIGPYDGHILPLIKIEPSDNEPAGLVLYASQYGGWRRPSEGIDIPLRVYPLAKETLAKAINQNVNVDIKGVSVGDILFVHVPIGWSTEIKGQPFKTASGYFVITPLGPEDLVRMEPIQDIEKAYTTPLLRHTSRR